MRMFERIFISDCLQGRFKIRLSAVRERGGCVTNWRRLQKSKECWLLWNTTQRHVIY